MAKMDPTKEQEDVIRAKTSNILVSAAAGSGKTYVLTQRVLHLLTKMQYSLKEMIILTFTNLAAKNMRDKITKELKKNRSTNSELDEELKHVSEASIQTFDSFCEDFVKKYSDLTDIPPSFQIGDEALFEMKINDFLKEILSPLFVNPTTAFDKFITDLAPKNVDSIYKYFSEVYRKIINIEDHQAYLISYVDTYFSLEEITKNALFFVNIAKKRIENIYNDLSYGGLSSKASSYFSEYDDRSNKMCEMLKTEDLDSFFRQLSSMEPKGLNYGDSKISKEDKEILKSLKNTYNAMGEIIKFCPYTSLDDFKDSFNRNKDVAAMTVDVLLKLDQKLTEYKKEHSIYTFTDITKKAIEILKKNEFVRDYYKKNIKEILIDEYQDTNDLNDTMIKLISNNNVVVVGDIKQSIYRFRNANPSIFKSYYDGYKNEGNGIVYDLMKNFRSRKEEVVDPINKIFKNIMTEEIASLDYCGQELVFGQEDYLGSCFKENEFRTILIDEDTSNPLVSTDEIEEDNDVKTKALKNSEKDKTIEFRTIAYDIKMKMQSGAMVMDSDSKQLRKPCYKDFLIISHAATDFDELTHQLEQYQIPYFVEASKESFTKTEEVIFIKNSLKLLLILRNDGNKDDFMGTVLSVLRSFVFQVSDNQIHEFSDKKKYPDRIEAFKLLFPDIYNEYNKISQLLDTESYYKATKEIVRRFDLYKKLIRLPSSYDVEKREQKINSLLDKLRVYSLSNISLNEIIIYFDYLNKNDLDIQDPLKDLNDLDCVNIMTIHKSKGLEYPYVYVAGLGKKFITNVQYYFSKTYGINYKDSACPQFIAIKNSEKTEERKEFIRLLYVALTRARESLTIMIKRNDKREPKELSSMSYKQDVLLLNNDFLYENAIILSNIDNFELETNDNKEASDIASTKKSAYKELPTIVKEELITKKASHDVVEMNEEIKAKLDEGTHIHSLFERVSFLTDIENQFDILNIDEKYRDYLRNFKEQEVFKSFNLREFHELAFYFDNVNGIIDYLLEQEDKFIIIDFKMKNIDDPQYIDQLSTYKEYLKTRTDKEIETYLYSILNNELRKIN